MIKKFIFKKQSENIYPSIFWFEKVGKFNLNNQIIQFR